MSNLAGQSDLLSAAATMTSSSTATLVHEATYVVTTFDTDVACVTQTWKGFARSEEFREAMTHVMHFVEQEAPTRAPIGLLVDARNLPPLVHADMEWAADVIGPQLRAAGTRKVAFLAPTSALGRVSINAFREAEMTSLVPTVESQVFETDAPALRWLLER
jgi:hypothetical protein